MNSLVSIIIPVYNKEDKITECLNSICNQTYKELEIIIIDDGSTDDSGILCDKYAQKDKRVFVKHIPNGGVSNARNIGIALSSGKYIQFVDADDYIDNSMTQVLVQSIESNNSDMVVCGYSQIVNSLKGAEVNIDCELSSEPSDYMQLINIYYLDPLCGAPWNRIIRTSILKEHNIRFKEGISFAEDFSFVFDVVTKVKSISYIYDSLYNYNLDVQDSLSKFTRKSLDVSWEQRISFIIYFNDLLNTTKWNIEYKTLVSTIYFGLFTTSLIDRIKVSSASEFNEVYQWFKINTASTNFFDMERVDLQCRRIKKDVNAKKRNLKNLFQQCLLFFMKIKASYVFVKILFLFFARREKD